MKKILYICRSTGDAERIAAFVYLTKNFAKQTVLIDDFYEPVADPLLLNIIYKNAKVIRYNDLFSLFLKVLFNISSLLFSAKNHKRIKNRFFLDYYLKNLQNFSKTLLKTEKPDLVICDFGTLNYKVIKNLYTQIRQDAVANNIFVSLFQTGIHIFNLHKDYVEHRPISKICDQLFIYTDDELALYNHILSEYLPKITVLGSISMDGKFLDYVREEFSKINKFDTSIPIITWFGTNISGIDPSLNRTREIELNVLFLDKIVDSIKKSNRRYQLFIKPHPRVDIGGSMYEKFSELDFVTILDESAPSLGLAAVSNMLCSAMTTTLLAGMYFEKKILTLDSKLYYPNLGSFLDAANVNHINLNDSLAIEFENLIVSSKTDPVLLKYGVRGRSDFNVFDEYLLHFQS